MTKEINLKMALPDYGGRPESGFRVRNSTIAEFARIMQAVFVDQPVLDQTGLGDERYSFVLKWTPDPLQRPGAGAGPNPNSAAPAGETDPPPDLFTALQQQLGLRMQPAKAEVEALVIDKAEKPSAN